MEPKTPNLEDILGKLEIASPCPASWNDMTGNDAERFCDQCERNVYDFSHMHIDDIVKLVQRQEEGICARLYRRADGTVLTADCSVGARRQRKQRLLQRVAASVVGLSALNGCVEAEAPPVENKADPKGAVEVVEPIPSVMGQVMEVPSDEPSGEEPSEESVAAEGVREAVEQLIRDSRDGTGRPLMGRMILRPMKLEEPND